MKLKNHGQKAGALTLTLAMLLALLPWSVLSARANDEHTVRFYNNGELYKEESVKRGKVIAEPAPPEREGYDFLGWYEGGVPMRKDFADPVNYSIVLYARWRSKTSAWGRMQAVMEQGGEVRLSDYAVDGVVTPGEGDWCLIPVIDDLTGEIETKHNIMIIVPEGKSVTLDLDGCALDFGVFRVDEDGSPDFSKLSQYDSCGIVVYGDLTIRDSSEAGTGRLTGVLQNNTGIGSPIYVLGSFTLESGALTGNFGYADSCAFGFGGVLDLRGGAVTGNYSFIYGAVSAVDNESEVHVSTPALKLSGDITIRDNYLIKAGMDGENEEITFARGAESNLFVLAPPEGASAEKRARYILPTVTGALTGDVGVTYISEGNDQGIPKTGVFLRAAESYNGGRLTDADAACLTSDNKDCYVALNENGEAELAAAAKADTWSALQAALNNGGHIRLTGDCAAEESDSALTVPAGKTVTLDLNGHVIDRGLRDAEYEGSEAATNGNVLEVAGRLTLTDSRPDFEGTADEPRAPVSFLDILSEVSENTAAVTGGVITGGNVAVDPKGKAGCGVAVRDGGELIMNGGTITGNAARYGGGVYVGEGGSFTMDGGSIIKNTAMVGGGVYVDGHRAEETAVTGTFEMKAGRIAGNLAGMRGGGVDVEGTFVMSGGEISDNIAGHKEATKSPYGAGVFVNGYESGENEIGAGKFIMSGGAVRRNSTTGYGGGLCAFIGSEFTMSGGSITENSASMGGGVLAFSAFIGVEETFPAAALGISGDAAIMDNGDSNVFLVTSGDADIDPVITVTGALTGKPGSIGVTMIKTGEGGAAPATGVFAVGGGEDGHKLTAADVACFVSDNAAYDAVRKDNSAQLLESSWSTLQNRLDDVEEGESATIVLYRDYVATESDTGLRVKPGTDVTLDLNGHILDRGLTLVTEESDNTSYYGYVIVLPDDEDGNKPGAGLTVKDSRPAARHLNKNNEPIYTYTNAKGETTEITGGVITGGAERGGVRVWFNSSFTLSGGTIFGNRGCSAGGLFINGEFTMTGGAVVGNVAECGGGGAAYVALGRVKMTGGTIECNTSYEDYEGDAVCGGLLLEPNCTFTMTGGTITGNRSVKNGNTDIPANNGFGGVYSESPVVLSGDPVISGNTDGNLCLVWQSVTVDGELTGEPGSIGVTMLRKVDEGEEDYEYVFYYETSVFAEADVGKLTADDISRFVSDAAGYSVVPGEDGRAYIHDGETLGGSWKDGKLSVTVVSAEGGTLIIAVYDKGGKLVSAETETVAAGAATVRLFETTIEKTAGYSYRLMLVDSDYIPLCAADSVNVAE